MDSRADAFAEEIIDIADDGIASARSQGDAALIDNWCRSLMRPWPDTASIEPGPRHGLRKSGCVMGYVIRREIMTDW
jgi:hypothetical protein